jgi:hypothetical protein
MSYGSVQYTREGALQREGAVHVKGAEGSSLLDRYIGLAGVAIGTLGMIVGYVLFRIGRRIKDPCWAIITTNLVS